ncbi:DUF1428 domain-containing protein [Sulfitobacter donghicola]|uniref:RNA signal recognition particle 4.5S RNA n=1 Tax=Sulfitobacter donghicola DSW-25 = KCTC 12864 = JCM 14565 TaxID=1300350 RepID=A0A073IFJ6_9RHOB|nr:DUF1428 domain-containing protein [Sulfitobacter donghicola]KEJ89113.1 RNA signal recognition particle 4.5S RNA [Sulfitobacter donghicola DSW-25 = KCTC 12864 = JCM 14565]KIN67310.1 DUF1428 domain containing protein [Sulfitobacter donghicola DSW-25 = KCTC 12864 = JCM 14565]
MYVMSFVAAVPTDQKEAYLAHCVKAAEIFKSHGALRVVELWGDMVPEGEKTSFPLAVAAKEGETVVTGWQEWPDKATCDANIEKAMSDPRLAEMGALPFDGARMIYGGFDALVDV